ncbi:MAG: winged helix-turn-helix transcriptional regulator [Candidatus Altiarchaeales archaeon]|nr:winged helix-turn-helix transcriptional regulator [Candidatus Altiarchaeales archaeon]MBD3416031.1 winged helix-turn-helix transcriptional regulator [Candidatus Altiarchaeales archaeon]
MVDETRLLELLEGDARTSLADLATMLGSSKDEVEKAIERLRKKGVIKGSRTVVDWRKVDGKKAVAVIQVQVVPQQKYGFDRVCEDIAKDKRVSDLFITSGKYDLMVTVRADDIDEISEFVTDKLAPMKEVTGTFTHVILKEFKRDGALFHEAKRKRLPVS